MKFLFSVLILFCGIAVNAQKVPEHCNQLPLAKVDTKAELTNDLADLIQSNVPSNMKKGNFEASYKYFVDCKGSIDQCAYFKGDLNEEQQAWLTAVMGKATWKAGILEDKYVTSVVFIQVSIVNGKVEITL